jgi:hypothetical protein
MHEIQVFGSFHRFYHPYFSLSGYSLSQNGKIFIEFLVLRISFFIQNRLKIERCLLRKVLYFSNTFFGHEGKNKAQ